MAPTKAPDALDAWLEVAQNAVRLGGEGDLSGLYGACLNIVCALSSTTAHTGTQIIVQINGYASGEGGWTTLTEFVGPQGTAVKADFAGTEAAAQTELSITNPATAGVDNDGKWKFVEHTTDVTKCEVVYQVSNTGDVGDTVTIAFGLLNEQTADSDLWDIDSATAKAVGMYVVALPDEAQRVRVIYNNKWDPDGATVHTMSYLSTITAVA